MLKFDPNKNKSISFKVNVEGIDPTVLEYNLRLSNGNIDYGFKGTNNNGEVSFDIPPLKEIVNNNILYDLNEVKLEVHDSSNKYYLKPFHDEVKIHKEPKVEAKVNEEKECKEDFSVSATLSEQDDKPQPPPSKYISETGKERHKTKFGEFLDK